MLLILLPGMSYFLYTVILISLNSFFEWMIAAFIYAAVVAIILIIYSFIFERKELFSVCKYVKQMFKRKKIKS